MIKITFDTNCIINLLDIGSSSTTSVDELSEIFRYGLEGDVNISITTRVEADVNKDKNEERKNELIKRLSIFPTIGTIVRIGSSKWDSGDVYAGNDHVELENELRKIIFPSLKNDDTHYTNKINDIDHLIGHKINNRDIFVTDDQQILKKADVLKSSLSIAVMSPKETLEYLNLQANKIVLVEEFYEKFLAYKKIALDTINQGKISQEESVKFEEYRRWLIRKYPRIKNGLFNFKFQLISTPTMGGKSVFDQIDLIAHQTFNDRINGVLGERNPLDIPKIASTHRHDYGFTSERDQIQRTNNFFNELEDILLGYIGKLEDK